MFLAFQSGVMYVLSFATIITLFADCNRIGSVARDDNLPQAELLMKEPSQGKASVNYLTQPSHNRV
jgi:hypothetical protein